MTAPDASPGLLLVCERRECFEAVVAAAHRIQPALRLEWARTSAEAARRVVTGRCSFVLVDSAIDGGAGRALVRHLARWRPALPVIAMADDRQLADASAGLPQPTTWVDLDDALRRLIGLADSMTSPPPSP